MALLHPVPGSTLTQKFGVSSIGVEPAMFASATRAYWQAYSGLVFKPHFHAAIDLGAASGTHIVASEAGRVVESRYDSTNGGGNKVTVEIRPNVRYTSNHMSSRWVTVGQSVKRGQTIGLVGATGYASGNHDHFQITIKETDGAGVARTFMYNPQLFLPGGSMSADPRISPIVVAPTPTSYVVVNGAGINCRTSPDLDIGSANIYATSTPSGWMRAGKVIAPLSQKMKFSSWVSNDDGQWAKCYLGGAYRYIKRELIHFV